MVNKISQITVINRLLNKGTAYTTGYMRTITLGYIILAVIKLGCTNISKVILQDDGIIRDFNLLYFSIKITCTFILKYCKNNVLFTFPKLR